MSDISKEGARRKAKQAAGICRACPEPAAPGKALCLPCLLAERERQKQKRAARVATGLCFEFGCRRMAAMGHVRCRSHHEKFLAYYRKWSAKRRSGEK